jgi:hypothetical protein
MIGPSSLTFVFVFVPLRSTGKCFLGQLVEFIFYGFQEFNNATLGGRNHRAMVVYGHEL